jgi:hypothetical protein
MTEPNKPREVRALTPLEYLQVQARKQKRIKSPVKKPPMVEPDALCYAYDRPKAAFFTEGKAYQALVVAQARRAAEGNPHHEKRFYKCKSAMSDSRIRQDHFHLTSMTDEDFDRRHEEAGYVSQD